MEVAEAEGHHPDLHLTNYRDVKVRPSAQATDITYARSLPSKGSHKPAWFHISAESQNLNHISLPQHWDAAQETACAQVDLSTHAIGGLSKNDFIVAAKIDAVPTEYSPKWLREHKEKLAAS